MLGFPCCSRFSLLLLELSIYYTVFNIVKEAFIPLSRAESLVVSAGTPCFKLCLEQRLLSSWWSDCGPKYCCRSAFAVLRYAIYLQGDINTSATRNRKKLLWFEVSFQGLNSIQMYVSGLHIFSWNMDKILQKLSDFMVKNQQQKTTKPKQQNLQKEEKPGGFNQTSVCNFCMQYTSSHNILLEDLETSKVMFVGRNNMFY